MSIEIREKTNLFDLIGSVDAICHGVNAMGVMGAGIAKDFRARWETMYQYYRGICHGYNWQGKSSDLGGYIIPWKDDEVMIYNMFTQIQPGAHAEYQYVVNAFGSVFAHMRTRQYKTLGVPYMIGCGIGGLDVNLVMNIIEIKVGTNDDIHVICAKL